MIGATLYLVGKEADTGEYVRDANACSMCKRQIINAGILRVVIRETRESFKVIDVDRDWVQKDDSLEMPEDY